ncbi:hypothetical protein MP228_002496 [Amoeboaphelidium protococcarum]|nr:hypothetical protein MP228_002496 [Amoeboaphelidium protococcarum]
MMLFWKEGFGCCLVFLSFKLAASLLVRRLYEGAASVSFEGGVRLCSRVWRSVTEVRTWKTDILRDAKPENLFGSQIAKGKVTKKVLTVIDSDIYNASVNLYSSVVTA